MPAAERQVVAATTGSAASSNEPALAQKLEGNAEPVGADDKHRLEWREGEGRWVCVRCARSCKGRDAGGKNRLMAKTCAGRVETRAEAIARTKLSQGAAARAAARETAGGDVAKARRVDMADQRSAARTTVVGARKANGDAGASAAMESAKRPIADRARAFGDLVRAVGRQGACQPFLGERTEVCRALVPLGLPPMAGLTRRTVFMAAKHTEAALKGMVTALGGSWRKVIGPAAKSGGARKGPGWGDSVEPVYGARPQMPLWEDAKEPAGSGPSEGPVAEAPGLDADEKKHKQQHKHKQNRTKEARSEAKLALGRSGGDSLDKRPGQPQGRALGEGASAAGGLRRRGSSSAAGELSAGGDRLSPVLGSAVRTAAGRRGGLAAGNATAGAAVGKRAAAAPEHAAPTKRTRAGVGAAAASPGLSVVGSPTLLGRKRGRAAPAAPD